jgi:hypothetical protein
VVGSTDVETDSYRMLMPYGANASSAQLTTDGRFQHTLISHT